MPLTDAQERALKKYHEKTDVIRVVVPKEVGVQFRLAAEKMNVSLSALFRESLEARLDQDMEVPAIPYDKKAISSELITSYEYAMQNLIEANKAQFIAQQKYQACADALKNHIKEINNAQYES